MPKRTEGRQLFAEEHLARRVAIERDRRGWTYAGLSKRTADAGCAIAQSALWKIENPPPQRPRRITVDELVVLAKVFDMPMAELVLDPAEVMPGHLAELAEKAVSLLHRMYQLELESGEVAEQHAQVMEQLREGLEGESVDATRVLALFDAKRPADWVVGTEEHHLWGMVRAAIERQERRIRS